MTILTGLGLSFGTSAEAVGIQLRGDIDITDKWGGSLNFIPYFVSDANYWEVNFDGHYMFLNNDPVSVYGLAGLNVSTVGAGGGSIGGITIPRVNLSRAGFNIGAGARYAIAERIVLYGEVKYILSSFDQLVISLGGMYTFPL